MATREEWTRLINLSHELALIEDDLRTAYAYTSGSADYDECESAESLASRILFERFGVDV